VRAASAASVAVSDALADVRGRPRAGGANGKDYLLSWNCKHIANAMLRVRSRSDQPSIGVTVGKLASRMATWRRTGGQMKLRALVRDPESIERFLRHQDLWSPPKAWRQRVRLPTTGP